MAYRASVGKSFEQLGVAGSGLNTTNQKMKRFPVNQRIFALEDGSSRRILLMPFNGMNFVAVANPGGTDFCRDCVEDVDGTLWAIFETAGGDAFVYSSTNLGGAWTLRYTHTSGYSAFNISVNQSRGDKCVAITGKDTSGDYHVVVSVDSGATWNIKPLGVAVTTLAELPLLMWVQDRLVVFWGTGTGLSLLINHGVWGGSWDISSLTEFVLTPGTLGNFTDYSAFNSFTEPPVEDDLLVLALTFDSNGNPLTGLTVTSPNLTWTIQESIYNGSGSSDLALAVATAPVPAGFTFATEEITVAHSSTGGNLFWNLFKVMPRDGSPASVVSATTEVMTGVQPTPITYETNMTLTGSQLGIVASTPWDLFMANIEDFGSTAESNWTDVIGDLEEPSDDWYTNDDDGYFGPFVGAYAGAWSGAVTFTKDDGPDGAENLPWLAVGLVIEWP